MPKHLKEALENYFRDAGARTEREQQDLLTRLRWKVTLRKGKLELLKSPAGDAQIVHQRDEAAAKVELKTILDGVIKPAEEGP